MHYSSSQFSQPIFTSSLIRLAPRRKVLQFGQGSSSTTLHLPKAHHEFRQVLSRSPELYLSYGEFDFTEIFPRLPESQQKQFYQLSQNILAPEVDSLRRAGKLGFIEESSDMIFELYTLKALRNHWITQQQVESLQTEFNKTRKEGHSFEEWQKQLETKLPEDTVNAFQKMINWPQKPEQSKKFMNLIISKFLLMRNRDPEFDIKKQSQHLLHGEYKELDEILPRFSPRRLQLALLTAAYNHLPFLPVKLFQNQLSGIVTSQLKVNIKPDDLLENVYAKQYRRQAFDYHNPHFSLNKERKKNLKGIELIQEASILKWVLTGHPNYAANPKPAGYVV